MSKIFQPAFGGAENFVDKPNTPPFLINNLMTIIIQLDIYKRLKQYLKIQKGRGAQFYIIDFNVNKFKVINNIFCVYNKLY